MSKRPIFTPFGTVSARGEFRDYHPRRDELPTERAEALIDVLGPASEFDVDEDIFFLAWEILSLQTDMERRPMEVQRAVLLMVLATLLNLRQGSTCLPLRGEDGIARLLRSMIPEEHQSTPGWQINMLMERIEDALVHERLGQIVGTPEDFTPLVWDGRAIYHQRMLHYETALVEALRERFDHQEPSIPLAGYDAALQSVLDHMPTSSRGPVVLTEEQQLAIETVLHEPLTIITGGPGTGKTSVVVSLLRVAGRLGVGAHQIALAAPTGKAANRLHESIASQLAALPGEDLHEVDCAWRDDDFKTQTLHRLLGYNPRRGQFHHHAHHKLPVRLLIIDEASMIDVFMMSSILRAARPSTHVVLLGDVDQLPSVDAGAVLRELVPEDDSGLLARATVRLTKSHRMSEEDAAGRHILTVARRVRDGDTEGVLDPDSGVRVRARAEELEFAGVELLPVPLSAEDPNVVRERLSGFVDRWFHEHIAPPEGFSAWTRHAPGLLEGQRFDATDEARVRALFVRAQHARLLCVTRVFATGTQALNELLLARARAALGGRAMDVFLPGVPVMMLRNDYDKEIFNGDQGVIVPTRQLGRRRTERVVVFARGGELRIFPLEGLRARLEPAYAMTVHKSQGSEFTHVAVVLPAEPLPLWTREVVYTALTRSAQASTLLGEPGVFVEGVRAAMVRTSRVMERV